MALKVSSDTNDAVFFAGPMWHQTDGVRTLVSLCYHCILYLASRII